MSSIEELALQRARIYLNAQGNLLASAIKSIMESSYPGGWTAFYEETFRDLVA